MKILLIGPQGSGKSTQAKLLADFLRIPKISTGDIFRQMAEQDSEEGRNIKQIMSSGKLIDDQTTAELVKQTLQKSDYNKGFILDGYPRNLTQKDLFDPEFDKAVYLKVSDEEVVRRLVARGRLDDSPEAIQTRLNIYNEQTKPLLDYYQNQGKLIEVNGAGSIKEIQNRIQEHFIV